MYSVVPEGFSTKGGVAEGLDMKQPVTGASRQIADFILGLGELGFEEVRCDVYPRTSGAVEAMQPVVEMVHKG